MKTPHGGLISWSALGYGKKEGKKERDKRQLVVRRKKWGGNRQR